jgi:hypothetical protein
MRKQIIADRTYPKAKALSVFATDNALDILEKAFLSFVVYLKGGLQRISVLFISAL